MRLNAQPISELRLQRHHRWMVLWLKWFASFLAAAGAIAPLSRQAIEIAHHWLDKAEGLLFDIILIRAARHVRALPTLKHSAYRRTETHLRRAIIGSAIRRAVRSRRLDQRIAALSQDVQALVTRLLERVPHGLTRRRAIRARSELRGAACVCVCESVVLTTDTS